MDDGHLMMDIPFRNDPEQMPHSERWLNPGSNLLPESSKSKTFYAKKKHVDGMTELIENGYAERVVDSQSESKGLWYLPHHNVVNPHKPDKFRIVFDCAAEAGGVSLNKTVLQGPDNLNQLLDVVLMRFRESTAGNSSSV